MSTSPVFRYAFFRHDPIHLPGDRELFYIDFCVDFQFSSSSSHLFNILLSSERLVEDIPTFTRMHLCPFLSNHDLLNNSLIPDIVSAAQSILQNRPTTSDSDPIGSFLFSLRVVLEVFSPYEDEDIDLNMAMHQSMQQVRMVPATKEAIASLIKKVKIVKDECEAEQCSICLEEFEDDEDVSAMPCDHIYHDQCIVQWLKTSHMCPLCRYQMPAE